jgi:iron complex outermembrane receptor protein
MRTFLLLISFVSLTIASRAQQVSGLVKDEQGKALDGVSVILKKIKDSAIVKISVTNAAGKYEYASVPDGNYFVNVVHIGFAPANSASFTVQGNNITVPDLLLRGNTKALGEVVVSSKKPMIEVKADKIVMNVEGSVNAVGQNALELLRKSPGVLVDKDDNLSLSGKNGVQVYIDNRKTPIAGKDLAEYLKTIQSTDIESIEIISNPSAKYDAAGNAGIINIRLKKNKAFGTNGSVSTGYNIGVYPKYNGSLALNHRNKSINVFGNYTYNHSLSEVNFNLYRTQLDTLFDQKSTFTSTSNSHTFKTGLDYFINRKSTLGVMVNGNFSDNTAQTYSNTPISYIPTGQVNRILSANNRTEAQQHNNNINLNYHYTDTSGHDLAMDGDYGTYRIKSDQLQPNVYLSANGATVLYSNIFNMLAPTDIDIASFKTDYEQNFQKGKLGLGGKIAHVLSDNDFTQYRVFNTGKTYDTLRSNHFKYKETISAAYANYNRALKGITIQAGLRMEHTNTTGTSNGYRSSGGALVVYDSSFTRSYTNLFPSAAITFNKDPMKQWTFTYSRRIDRPAYQDLNPFENKLDEYTFQKGNTQLRPQYTNSFGATYMYKYRLTTTLNYSHVTDVFTQLVDTAERSKAFITKKNLATQDIISLNMSYPFQKKWYSVFANLNTYYSMYKADFGTGRKINLNVFAISLFAQQSFTLGKGWTAETSGFYNSPSVFQGTFKTQTIWSIDAGIQKTVLKNQGNLKVSVSDIFHTLQFTATSDFAGQFIRANGAFESRMLKIAFSYRFGSNTVKAARQRTSGADDETKRVNSGGGLIKSN